MNSRWLWNSHQRHKFLRVEASRDISKIRVSEMGFPGVFKRCFPQWTPCCFVRIHERLGTMPLKCPRCSKTSHSSNVSQVYPVRICVQCHSKLQNGCFTILFNDAYFLLAVMVEGDESSQLRMAN